MKNAKRFSSSSLDQAYLLIKEVKVNLIIIEILEFDDSPYH